MSLTYGDIYNAAVLSGIDNGYAMWLADGGGGPKGETGMKISGFETREVEIEIDPRAAILMIKNEFYWKLGLPREACSIIEKGGRLSYVIFDGSGGIKKYAGPMVDDNDLAALEGLISAYEWFDEDPEE